LLRLQFIPDRHVAPLISSLSVVRGLHTADPLGQATHQARLAAACRAQQDRRLYAHGLVFAHVAQQRIDHADGVRVFGVQPGAAAPTTSPLTTSGSGPPGIGFARTRISWRPASASCRQNPSGSRSRNPRSRRSIKHNRSNFRRRHPTRLRALPWRADLE